MHNLQPTEYSSCHWLHGPHSKGEPWQLMMINAHQKRMQCRIFRSWKNENSFSHHLQCNCCCLQLWDVENGKQCSTLSGHTAEIVSVSFNTAGDLLVTGSFDHDSRLWDVRTGQCVHVLSGHRGEVSNSVFNHAGGATFAIAYRIESRHPALLPNLS